MLSFRTIILLVSLCSSSISFYTGIYIGRNMECLESSVGTNHYSNLNWEQQQQKDDEKQTEMPMPTPTPTTQTKTKVKLIDWEDMAKKQQRYIKTIEERDKRQRKELAVAIAEMNKQQQQNQNRRHQLEEALLLLETSRQTQITTSTELAGCNNWTQQLQRREEEPCNTSSSTFTTQSRQSSNSNSNSNSNSLLLPRIEYVNRTQFKELYGNQLGIPQDMEQDKTDTPNNERNDRVLILYSDLSAYPNDDNNNNDDDNDDKKNEVKNNNDQLLFNDVEHATQNCNLLRVILTDQHRDKQCIAIMGQSESFHIHRFMRLPQYNIYEVNPNPVVEHNPTDDNGSDNDESGGKISDDDNNDDDDDESSIMNPLLPLRPVPRGQEPYDGKLRHELPTKEMMNDNWKELQHYKSIVNEHFLQSEIKPLVEQIIMASNQNNQNNDNDPNTNIDNTVIVMVCNFGQSEILLNFICNARSKGLDNLLSQILLFATDHETYELATSMGLTSYYSSQLFQNMPIKAAEEYADDTFRSLMFAKVYCVHLISQLGYDLLFQDVDVIWYKNPLLWFHNKTNPDYHFDMFFQDDGSRGLMYAPYSPNTGFYYVRNNKRTQFFFHSLLMSGGDMIMATYSHQIALNALLSEHISLYGLSVKICNSIEFPSGYTFHNEPTIMKEYLGLSSSSSLSSSSIQQQQGQGQESRQHNSSTVGTTAIRVQQASERQPYIFHFCWANHKYDKIHFMEQLGEWYLQESCKTLSNNDIMTMSNNSNSTNNATTTTHSDGGGNSNGRNNNTVGISIIQHCCSVKPLVKCHYKDKPSIVPCLDSPSYDGGGDSFW